MIATKSPLWNHLSRCIAASLVLWLLTLTACGSSGPTPTPTPTIACNSTPTSAVSPVVGTVTTPSPDDNTIYTLHTPNTTRFWRAGIIVIALAATPQGTTFPTDPSVINHLINQVIDAVHSVINSALSQNNASVAPTEESGTPSFISLGTTAALFLSIHLTPVTTQPPIGDINLEKVVNAINDPQNKIIGETVSIGNVSAIIRAASPDWLSGGGGGGFTGGHPDGSPSSACGKAPTALTCKPASGSTTVYVLDTAYPLATTGFHANITGSLTGIPPTDLLPVGNGNCNLFTDLAQVTLETDVALDDEVEYGLKILNPNYVDSFEFREHGLFISALIHHIAPQAHIRLIRVLNDQGVGDLQALFYGFNLIMNEHRNGAIVNMSLGLIPPPQCLQNIWNAKPEDLATWEKLFGGSQERALMQLDGNACSGNLGDTVTNDPNTKLLYVSLGLMIDALVANTHDSLVAASGNDTGRFGAELPAALCNVTSVGATENPVKNWQYQPGVTSLAPFSNVPYFEVNSAVNPPITYCLNIDPGGAVRESTTITNTPAVAVGTGICSLLLHRSGDRLGVPAGLAMWQGTSFSTAIISGNLASLNRVALPSGSILAEGQPCG